MKQKFDVRTAIKTTRWMGFVCTGLSFMFLVAALFLGVESGVPFMVAILPLNLLAAAFGTMFHLFRSQQSETDVMQVEIDQLKATVRQLQGSDQSAIST
ncbi:hypothetical protein [Symmachiella dynata]|uniref:hypothetical protein n=1 Tax=Symmachiella dynata TaxID=2527995 RepID=UPI00118A05BE|nr:hypothetical protein [Symmachiella dynata]QDT51351.1 hypothetical protein Pan258_54400 [Symmachiella dynata]|tara:strand:+ start:451 stop:747 length:297 start_codon:yes stop_codon:yes gene_type:complete